MRDYQTKSNVGALPDSNSAEKLGGGEATSLRLENKTAVTRSGLTLAPQDGSGEDTTQQAQAMMINGLSASSFQAAGTANAITLTPVTGSTGLKLPPDYSSLDGMDISFFAAFTNASATIFSIGQTTGTQFGTKKILDEAGADLVGGEIIAGGRTDMIYDAAADGGSGAAILRPSSVVTVPTANGQCFLDKNGTNLELIPFNGDKLIINGITETVPASTLLAPGALPADTDHYIYAFMSGSTLTLEASTTGHSTHTDGVEIKTGDATRSLVGMARPITGPLWVDSLTQRFVRSWFNRKSRSTIGQLTTDRSTSSTTYVEINTEIRVEFLIFADETADSILTAVVNNSTAGQDTFVGIGFDSGTPESTEGSLSAETSTGSADQNATPAFAKKTGLSEGFHYATLTGKVSAGTGNYRFASGSRSTVLSVTPVR